MDSKKDIKSLNLEELKTESRTMILYEAPHHLIRTLEELYAALGERRITLCRELTKKFETVFPTTLEKALDYYKTEEPRGEYVLVVEGKSPEEKRQEEIASWESMSIEEHMAYYEEQRKYSQHAADIRRRSGWESSQALILCRIGAGHFGSVVHGRVWDDLQ